MSYGRKKPMGEQAVPEWGLYPWMELMDVDERDFTFRAVAEKLDREEKRKSKDEQRLQETSD
jgi:hypothetical protein